MGYIGRKMTTKYKYLGSRSPFARILVFATAVLALIGLTFRSEGVSVQRSSKLLQHPASTNHTTPQKLAEGTQRGLGAHDREKDHSSSAEPPVLMDCSLDMEHMQELKEAYGLDDKFEYIKRYVKFSRQAIPRKSMTYLNQRFLPAKNKFWNLNKSYREVCAEPLYVPVTESPLPATANLSDFMFGVSTTFERFNSSATSPVNEWTYWLTDGRGHTNGGKLVLFLLEATDDELELAAAELRGAGIDADIYHSDPNLEMAVRYLTLVPALYKHPDRKGRKWLVTCDDDTFFPSPHALAERFAEYNSTMPMYIGTLSEDVNNIDRHGSQAFGGAGVFLSVPMAATIAGLYEDCRTDEKVAESNSGWGPQGDILLRKCIYEHTEVRLTTLWDLWQLDMYGDPSGFYESGIRPLSLHHYRGGGWHVAHPWHYTKVAHVCGEDCTLQRFRTTDDFVLSTSFSVSHYPRGVDFDTAQMERTFSAAMEDKGWNLDFMFGPQRPSLHKTGRKISWDLKESTVEAAGRAVRQTYVRRKDDWRWVDPDGAPMSRTDGVIELVWIADRETDR